MLGSAPRAPPPSQEPHVGTQRQSIPVVPATAAPVWVPGQVGSKQKAGVSRLAPGTLAGVGQAVLTGQPSRGESRARSLQPTPMHTHPSLDLAGLTGCRVVGTPLGSSERLGPGLAGCMLHLLCGWCSDATHRRGPGVKGQGQNSAYHQLPLPPAPRLPATTSSQRLTPCSPPSDTATVYLALSLLDNSSSVRSEERVDLKSFGSRDMQIGIYSPSLRYQIRNLHKAQPKA